MTPRIDCSVLFWWLHRWAVLEGPAPVTCHLFNQKETQGDHIGQPIDGQQFKKPFFREDFWNQ